MSRYANDSIICVVIPSAHTIHKRRAAIPPSFERASQTRFAPICHPSQRPIMPSSSCLSMNGYKVVESVNSTTHFLGDSACFNENEWAGAIYPRRFCALSSTTHRSGTDQFPGKPTRSRSAVRGWIFVMGLICGRSYQQLRTVPSYHHPFPWNAIIQAVYVMSPVSDLISKRFENPPGPDKPLRTLLTQVT